MKIVELVTETLQIDADYMVRGDLMFDGKVLTGLIGLIGPRWWELKLCLEIERTMTILLISL